MSVDINWDTLTGGSDGAALAETVRAFVHDKFQQVTLPRFIRSVKVHSFDFGSIAPVVELKDVCDPLPDFYEEDGSDSSGEDDPNEETTRDYTTGENSKTLSSRGNEVHVARHHGFTDLARRQPPINADTRLPGLRTGLGPTDVLGGSLQRAPTPGIPGGTSNLSYFHLPLGAGLSGTTTPLAAVAGAQFHNGWPDHNYRPHHLPQPTSARDEKPAHSRADIEDFAIDQHGQSNLSWTSSPRQFQEKSPEDVQVVSRVKYAGDIKLSLTAEILLDYPMPSFVGIPLKLNITGLTFDGVAILAYIKKKAHFCFLSPDDADALIGDDVYQDGSATDGGGDRQPHVGGLLEEIKVESEIGQKENGKQVLKNVGKVEKFVLEQVRRIFEDEFVYPSFWTFLV
ncbi:Mitochondrial distribution and morphology protein 12 [Coniosporium tulheliwenetii]|uniref:Mitochondrial distribution and morphology protein 12 n=1 Tax=Coniosporium tulheliwenetii TaxID=3383036 RepID=A0ACC2ZG45_9PEZI|nr:Mitochondrial distribution and morphology protein 12 [Cladosporium sp. JES 115]